MSTTGNRWIEQILALQQEDGSFGTFHTLSMPTSSKDITTEQALRRLSVLGLTKEDEPIRSVLTYIKNCLLGDISIPDRREKVLNWDAFQAHMLAAWIKHFDPTDETINPISDMWSDIISKSFSDGSFDSTVYEQEYRKRIPKLNSAERLINISTMYMVILLKDNLDEVTENRYIDYVIDNPKGIYYVYPKRIRDIPSGFQSLDCSCYLAALELLADYNCSASKLAFARDWILFHREQGGRWDLGPKAYDRVYFPLSDSWRDVETRRRDCTERIEKLLKKIHSEESVKL
ncbi:MAG: hypothetical protein FWG21_03185 [Oscillospiraceae bacterium]|nr:hypothetical protein [Oscillospiraceae bacterium]